MKIVSWFSLMAMAGLMASAANARAGSFDGTWAVNLTTPEYKDPTGVVAKAYVFDFPAQVKDDVLHGERGVAGQPAWLEIDGKIDASGDAMLHVKGITGRPEYSLAHVPTGHPYEYDVKAHFTTAEGKGSRIGGRISTYTFKKK